MSEIQDAVRERYGAKANEIAKKARGTVTVGSLELSCSLTETELTKRRAEWLALDGALLRREEWPGVVETTYRASPQTRSRLERLVAAERDCCADARWSLQDKGSTRPRTGAAGTRHCSRISNPERTPSTSAAAPASTYSCRPGASRPAATPTGST